MSTPQDTNIFLNRLEDYVSDQYKSIINDMKNKYNIRYNETTLRLFTCSLVQHLSLETRDCIDGSINIYLTHILNWDCKYNESWFISCISKLIIKLLAFKYVLQCSESVMCQVNSLISNNCGSLFIDMPASFSDSYDMILALDANYYGNSNANTFSWDSEYVHNLFGEISKIMANIVYTYVHTIIQNAHQTNPKCVIHLDCLSRPIRMLYYAELAKRLQHKASIPAPNKRKIECDDNDGNNQHKRSCN